MHVLHESIASILLFFRTMYINMINLGDVFPPGYQLARKVVHEF